MTQVDIVQAIRDGVLEGLRKHPTYSHYVRARHYHDIRATNTVDKYNFTIASVSGGRWYWIQFADEHACVVNAIYQQVSGLYYYAEPTFPDDLYKAVADIVCPQPQLVLH